MKGATEASQKAPAVRRMTAKVDGRRIKAGKSQNKSVNSVNIVVLHVVTLQED